MRINWCGPRGREGQVFWSRVRGARVKRELSASVLAGRDIIEGSGKLRGEGDVGCMG
jgi:hypothetical protein